MPLFFCVHTCVIGWLNIEELRRNVLYLWGSDFSVLKKKWWRFSCAIFKECVVLLCFLLNCLTSSDHYLIHSHTDLCHASCLSSCYATIIVIPVIPVQSPVPHSFRSSVAFRPMYLVPHQNLICGIWFVLPNLCKYADSSLASPFFFSPDLQLIKQ